MAKDVIVVVQRDALPTEKESLDILLVSTAGAVPVQVYRDIESVEAVFGETNPKIVRKAKTLLNQGKTTLANGLVNKFKIVGFEAPAVTEATEAKYVITVGAPSEPITQETKLYLHIGEDDAIQVELGDIETEQASTAEELAQLFADASFTKGSKTYQAAVTGATVTFTATEGGKADPVPTALLINKSEEGTTDPITVELTAEFTNGTDAVTPADNLIAAIQKFQADVDNDWYLLLTDKDDDDYVKALAKFAEASEPSEAELDAGIEDHRKFYVGQTTNKAFADVTARAAVIYTDQEFIDEEPDASYVGNVAPFYPESVTWKFKRPQDGNAPTSAGTKLISLPQLTEAERDALLENHVNFLTEEYKRQYVKEGTCLDGEFIDVVIGADWIAKRMRELLYDILLTNANINYGDDGFGLIAVAVAQALTEATSHNIIARDPESKAGVFSITIPKYADSTEEQRRNRVMPDILWEALLSGAVHRVKTKGVLRASL